MVGSAVQLGPLGTAVTNRPILPASGDSDGEEIGGMMIGRWNQRTWRKKNLPQCRFVHHKLPGREPTAAAWVQTRVWSCGILW
jgi:hypothetical protein